MSVLRRDAGVGTGGVVSSLDAQSAAVVGRAIRVRSRRVWLTVVGLVVALVVGLLVGRQVKSPADAAAGRRAPVASLVGVPVEERVVESRLVVRGTVRFETPTPLVLGGPVGGAGSAGSAAAIVTAVGAVGSSVGEGSVVVEVTGRPVFVLQGDVPMYRALGPGAAGKDVVALQAALVRLGFAAGSSGVFDAAAQAAVVAWYQSKGFQAQGPTVEQTDELRQARNDLAAAQTQLRQATVALEQGQAGSVITEAKNAVADAQDLVGVAQAEATRTNAAAAAEVTARQVAAAASKDALERGRGGGVDPANPPAVCTPACLARLDAAAKDADAQVTAAMANVDSVAASSQAGIDRAQRALTAARQQLNELLAPKTKTELQTAVTEAQAGVDQGTARVQQLEAEVGVNVPAGEVIFVPQLPLQLTEVKVKPGDVVSGAFATVASNLVVVDASVALPDAQYVKIGAKATLEATEAAKTFTGTVTTIADRPGTKGVDPQRVYVGIRPDDTTVATALNGANLKVTIPISTTGIRVLAVPVVAVTTSADGTARVQRLNADGTSRDIDVAAGLSADGYVQITPRNIGDLKAGDLVAVLDAAVPTVSSTSLVPSAG